MEGQSFVFPGEWYPEVGPDGAVAEYLDLVDEPFEQGLTGVGCAVAENVLDLAADLGQVARSGTLRRRVELELELGLAAAKLLDPFLEGGQAAADVVVLVVEGCRAAEP